MIERISFFHMRLARVYSLSIRNLYLRIFFSLVLVLHRYVRLERKKSISCSIVSIFHTHYSIDIYIYMYFPPYSLLFCRVRYIYINSDAYRSTCFLEWIIEWQRAVLQTMLQKGIIIIRRRRKSPNIFI